MRDETLRLILGALLFLHGIAHGGAMGSLWWVATRPGVDTGGWTGARLWAVPSMAANVATAIAVGLWSVAMIAFIVAALGFWGLVVPPEVAAGCGDRRCHLAGRDRPVCRHVATFQHSGRRCRQRRRARGRLRAALGRRAGGDVTGRASYRLETVIERPIDDVFGFLGDLRNEVEWNPGARRIEKLTPGAIGVGTRFHAEWRGAPRTEVAITRYEPPLVWQTRSRSWGMDVVFTGRLRAEGERTRYAVQLEAAAAGPARLLLPFAIRAMKRQDEAHMLRLSTLDVQPQERASGRR